jgi:hypothetical protein
MKHIHTLGDAVRHGELTARQREFLTETLPTGGIAARLAQLDGYLG